MTGWVPKATPAVAVGEGCVLIASRLAAAGLTTMLLELAAARAGKLVKCSEIVSAVFVREISEGGDAARGRHRRRPLERTGAERQGGGRHLGGVVAGLEIAVLVFDVDDRLCGEGDAGRRRGGWLRAQSLTEWRPRG